MKHIRPCILGSIAMATLSMLPLSAQGGGGSALRTYIQSLPLQSIEAGERVDLLNMRQEEKLARDVYQVLSGVWGIPAFANITESEQNHMDLVKLLLDRYGIPDPLPSERIGVFADPRYTQMFESLVAVGAQSPFWAALVGMCIEDLDIFDLDAALQRSDNRDLDTVWQNLQLGSRNHMRAFDNLLRSWSFTYPGVFLPYARIVAIVTSPHERGAVDENGDPLVGDGPGGPSSCSLGGPRRAANRCRGSC
ncbi:MAG: DUF2202 domain-containing protein [Planctomycetota bacterium]